MPTVNEIIQDEYIKHQILVLKYSENLSDKAVSYLKATEADLAASVLRYATLLEGKSLLTKRSKLTLKNMKLDIANLRGGAWDSIALLLNKELSQLAVDEAAHVSRVIVEAVPVTIPWKKPKKNLLERIPLDTLMEGKILKDWVQQGRLRDSERLTDAAVRNIADTTVSPAQTMRNVVGTKSSGYRDGAARTAWVKAEALVVTATTATRTQASTAVIESNPFVITEEYFVATLDSGTTPECIANDTLVFPVGEGPMPPLHFRCRSLRIPYVTPDNLITRAFDPSTEKELVKEYSELNGFGNVNQRGNLPYGSKVNYDNWARKRKNEMIGQLPEKVSYETFFAARSVSFQEQVMGVRRSALYREGKYPMKAYIGRQGGWLTLDQLRAKGMLPNGA